MGSLGVTINNRSFSIACDDGQEEHLGKLAIYLDKRVTELAASMGQLGDARLLLMAGLLIADELSDANARIANLEEQAGAASGAAVAAAREAAENAAADVLDGLAQRIESIATRLEQT